MAVSNIDLLKDLSKTCSFVDPSCKQRMVVHWTVLVAAGNYWLVHVGDHSTHIVIFPDPSITELEFFVQRLYCHVKLQY